MDLDKSFAKCCLVVANEGKLFQDKKELGRSWRTLNYMSMQMSAEMSRIWPF